MVDLAALAAVGYLPLVESASKIIAQLDILVSFAHSGLTAPTPYVKPDIRPMGSRTLDLEACRHACLEVQSLPNTGGRFIPNDVTMERGKSGLQLITGPNTGGKSCYIRQTGVAVLMAHVGCVSLSTPLLSLL